MIKNKSDKVESAKRVQAVYYLILTGYTYSQIVQNASSQWKITERQAADYIAKARALINAAANQDMAEAWAETVQRLRELQKDAAKEKDRKGEVEILKETSKLRGLYPAEKRDVKVSFEKMTDAEIIQFITRKVDSDSGA